MSTLLTQTEKDILNDCYEIMRKRDPDMIKRFGIWRVHERFEKSDDEVFYETSNPDTKESTLRIIKRSPLPEGAYPSAWKLTENGAIEATWCCDDSLGPRLDP